MADSDSDESPEPPVSKRAKLKALSTQVALDELPQKHRLIEKPGVSSLLPSSMITSIGGSAANIFGRQTAHTHLKPDASTHNIKLSQSEQKSLSAVQGTPLLAEIPMQLDSSSEASTSTKGLLKAHTTCAPRQPTSSPAAFVPTITPKSIPILDQITRKASVPVNDYEKSVIVPLDPGRSATFDPTLCFDKIGHEEDKAACQDPPEIHDQPNPILDFPSESTSNTESPGASLPLYENAEITNSDCMVSILAYALTNHLSGSATCELIDLLEKLLPKPNTLPKSAYLFKKYFKNNDCQLELFYYCTSCWKSRSSLQDQCTTCTDPKRKVSYFISCPLDVQLRKLYSRPGFREKLNYKYSRKKINAGNIEDIYDGSVYKEAEREFLNNPNNISLTWYSDGISIFECSTYSLWPCVYVINELPPEERCKPENVLIGGFWGGDVKPHPNIFLLPMYHEVKKLKEGVKVKPCNSKDTILVQGVIICGTCDIPAKSCFMNMKGHAGFYSCAKCLIRGEKSERTGNVTVFPHADNLELRTDQNYEECVLESVKHKEGWMGVFGPSLLSYMFSFSFISGMACDAMHCVYMGVMKQLLRLLFDSKYRDEPFSLYYKLSKANDRVRNINLPHFVQRLLLDFDVNLCYWKASLGRNFFLYVMLPVLKDLLPQEYFKNLCMLVEGVSLLNSGSISMADLERAERLLLQFCKDFQRLYGLRHMSLNIHYLRHLPQAVRETGNLHHTHCYGLEGLNGELANLVHGTRHAIAQIGSQLGLLSDLPLLIDGLTSDVAKQFCKRLTKKSSNIIINERISDDISTVGNFSDVSTYSRTVKELLCTLYPDSSEITDILYFDRLCKNRILYVSAGYERGSRVSTYCRYKSNNVYHGKILTFIKLPLFNKFFSLVQRSQDLPTDLPRFVEFCASNDVDLISVENLVNVTFCINVEGHLFLIDPLNSLELE